MVKMNKQDWRDLISYTKDELKKEKKAPTNSLRDEFIKNFNIRNIQEDLDHSYEMLRECYAKEPKKYTMLN